MSEDERLDAPLAGLDPAGGWRADVDCYERMLTNANQSMNLVGKSTLADFWSRHFIDSAQLVRATPATRVWADLGAGAGLPGIVLAILLKDSPGAHVHLVESMRKRCEFLSAVVEALSLPATVHHARAETLRLKVEVVTARACAPMARLLGYAAPYLAAGAKGLFLKGVDVDRELEEARGLWRFKSRSLQSLSDPRGRLVWIEELSRAT